MTKYLKKDQLIKKTVYEDNNILYYTKDNRIDNTLFNPPLILYVRNCIKSCMLNKIGEHLDSQKIGHGIDIAICIFVSIQIVLVGCFIFLRCKSNYRLTSFSNIFSSFKQDLL